MHRIREVIEILEDEIYSEFSENSIARINTDEAGKIADILKDFAMAEYYYCHTEVPEEDQEQTVDSMIFDLSCKLGTEDLNAIEKSAIKNKLQMMIKSLI